jgi:hypothetical protein
MHISPFMSPLTMFKPHVLTKVMLMVGLLAMGSSLRNICWSK